MTRLVARQAAIPGRLSPVDLAVDAGLRVAIIGPNGAGKTSLLRALALAEGAMGAVAIDGSDLRSASPRRRRALLGYVPASRDAVWPISVRDAVADGGAKPDDAAVAVQALELGPLAFRSMDAISTGERSRVFLARALAPAPPVVLADEPTANLDPYWRLRVLGLLGDAAARGAAVLMTIHDLDLALGWADRILLVEDGRVVADMTPAALERSRLIERVFRVARASYGWAAV